MYVTVCSRIGSRGSGVILRRVLVVGLVVVGVGLMSVSGARAAFLSPCVVKLRWECGRLVVPLDPSGAVKGTVSLAVRRVPACPRRGTVLFLAGGPGQAGEPGPALVLRALPEGLELLCVVTFDQRGTGGSGQLRCGSLGSLSAVNRCGRSLGSRIGLYTTVTSAMDLERVRQALGSPPLILVGVSYGGRVANEYARIFPGHTAALVLDSPTPLTGTDPFGARAGGGATARARRPAARDRRESR